MKQTTIDIEKPEELLRYLRSAGHIRSDESPITSTLHGGVSNRTVLVEWEHGQSWVLKQALDKLRVDVDWFSDPARIHREAQGMRYLAELAPAGTITRLVFEDFDQHLLAMEAVPRPHENWKGMLLAGRVDAALVEQFGALLGAIHHRSAEKGDTLRGIFGDTSYFESLRLEPYYAYSAEQVPAARDFLLELIEETKQRKLTLVHGDYSPKNILVHDGRLVLLDHEVIHWGDPAFDVGFALAHLLSKAHHVPRLRQRFAEAALQFVGVYSAVLGPVYWDANLEAFCVRHAMGCLLARALGRSPLEYLDGIERRRQRDTIGVMAHRPLATVKEFITWFLFGIQDHDDDHKTT